MGESAAVIMKGISKRFGYIQALQNVDFQAEQGQITAIVGDNGSGKSTLMKILSGCMKPDTGEIWIQGQYQKAYGIRQAILAGITTVYQDLALDDCKDCAENIFLGREILKYGIFLNHEEMYRQTQQLLKDLDIEISDITQTVKKLSGGQRQALAIARAVAQSGEIFIFDEPTSAMGVRESAKIMQLFARLKQQGKTILLISHNLFQVFDIADQIFVMRNGHCVDKFETKDATPQQLYDMIVAEEVIQDV